MKQLTALKTVTSSRSALCRVIPAEKCAQARIERDQSGVGENIVPFDIRKFGNSNRIFGQKERSP